MHAKYESEIAAAKEVLPDSVSEVELLAAGKRGVVLKGLYEGKTVAIKVKRDDSDATNAITLEATNLAKVNEWGIGPQLIASTDDYVIMELIDGKRIDEFLATATLEEKEQVLASSLLQCELLDEKGFNKLEMTNPYKHIIVKEDLSVVFIDFERGRMHDRSKNVSQFKEYMKKVLKN